MNNCHRYQDLISALTDNELTDSERSDLEAHLLICPSCTAYKNMLCEILHHTPNDTEPPAELLPGIMDAVRSAPIPVRRKNHKIGRLIALAACIAVIIAIPAISFGGLGHSAENSADYNSFVNGAESIIQDSAADNKLEFSESASPPTSEYAPEYEDNSASGSRAKYHATAEITGDLPEILKDFEMTDAGSGSYSILVPYSKYDELAALGISISVCDSYLDNTILVIYTP